LAATKDDEDVVARRWAVRGRVPALRAPGVDAADYYELVTDLAWRYAYLRAWATSRSEGPFQPAGEQVELDTQLAELAAWASRRKFDRFIPRSRSIIGALPDDLGTVIAELEAWASRRKNDPLPLYLGAWRRPEPK
jgi:hypothetical protein